MAYFSKRWSPLMLCCVVERPGLTMDGYCEGKLCNDCFLWLDYTIGSIWSGSGWSLGYDGIWDGDMMGYNDGVG